jgi:hypothetical protein
MGPAVSSCANERSKTITSGAHPDHPLTFAVWPALRGHGMNSFIMIIASFHRITCILMDLLARSVGTFVGGCAVCGVDDVMQHAISV